MKREEKGKRTERGKIAERKEQDKSLGGIRVKRNKRIRREEEERGTERNG